MRISDWSSDVCSSDLGGRDFARFLITDAHGAVRFEREGMDGTPVRVLQIPFLQGDGVPMLIALIEAEESSAPALGATAAATLGKPGGMMPFGTELVDRDGRLLPMHYAFTQAARDTHATLPVRPGYAVVGADTGGI